MQEEGWTLLCKKRGGHFYASMAWTPIAGCWPEKNGRGAGPGPPGGCGYLTAIPDLTAIPYSILVPHLLLFYFIPARNGPLASLASLCGVSRRLLIPARNGPLSTVRCADSLALQRSRPSALQRSGSLLGSAWLLLGSSWLLLQVLVAAAAGLGLAAVGSAPPEVLVAAGLGLSAPPGVLVAAGLGLAAAGSGDIHRQGFSSPRIFRSAGLLLARHRLSPLQLAAVVGCRLPPLRHQKRRPHFARSGWRLRWGQRRGF